MASALFTYRRRVEVVVNGEKIEKYNDNFINPINVTSFYWSESQDAKPILNVFLNAVRTTSGGTNAYSITFGESVGKRFVDHMEVFLEWMIWGRTQPNTQPANNTENKTGERHTRNARRPVDIVDEEVPTSTDVQFVS